jgi:integrase
MERNGTWYAVCHDKRRSTGYLATKNNIQDALRVLERFVVETTDPSANKALTVHEALQEFVDTKGDNVTTEHLATYALAVAALLPDKVAIEDARGIREQISVQRRKTHLNASSVRAYLQRLNTFFEWCIRADYCTMNPIRAVETPILPPPEPVAPTQDELNRIYDYLNRSSALHQQSRYHYILSFKFLALSGLRISEYMSLTHDCISESGIKVDGKRKRKNIPRYRYVAFALVPQLQDICAELSAKKLPGGLLAHRNHSMYRSVLARACIACDLQHFSPHDLRRAALQHWERKLHLPPHVVALMAGHSLSVRGHYHDAVPINDIIDMVSMEGISQGRKQ